MRGGGLQLPPVHAGIRRPKSILESTDMSHPALHYDTLLSVGARIQTGEMSAKEVTQAQLDRIAEIDPNLNSYATVCGERALEQAERADQEIAKGIHRGPMHGVPIALKDLCYTTFAPTEGGMKIARGFVPDFNATVVDRLEMAGAVTLGKLMMTEGAYTSHHPDNAVPANPWNPDYWVGSSSSGSGSATAAGLCYASLGSDTGGSIRYPSASCGLTGLKPTWGRVSRYGVYPLADSLDHIGPMARSAADCAAMIGPMAGWDPNDTTTIDAPVPDYLSALTPGLRDMRIGLDRSYAFDGVQPEVAAALERALDVLRDLGARIVDITLPPFKELVAVWEYMCAIETAMAHKETYPARASEYGPDLAQLIDIGLATTGVQAAEGTVLRLEYSGALKEALSQVDCMICPTMPAPTPSLAEMGDYGKDPEILRAIMNYTAPFDFSGNPTVTLPNGFGSNGMPLSMQFVGKYLGEAQVLRAAHAFQSATDWHCAYPDM